jgi:single-strand DNA-binding protein
MPSLNSVNLIGNLGANPESRTLPSGDQSTDWHRVELWGGLADVAMKFLQKGDLVFVEGKPRIKINIVNPCA